MKTIGSLFAGIGGFDLGFERAGFKTAWTCEIDQKAQAVLRYRFPNAVHHDDVTQVGAHNLGPVDVVTFGSPCQDLSVAGKRAGLAGGRSGLFHESARIIQELRAKYGKPDIAVWENVPGAFSSNGGRDFAVVVQTMVDIGARDVAWRVLDSRFFGVAQRRRRVFLVADFGGERAEQVLALSEGVRGYSPKGRKARQGAAQGAGEGAGGGRGYRMRAFGDYADDDTASAMKQRDWKDATDLVAVAGTLDTECEGGKLTHQSVVNGHVVIDRSSAHKDTGSRAGQEREFVAVSAPQPIAFHPTQDPISSTEQTHSLSCGSKSGTASVAVCVSPPVEPYTLEVRGRESGRVLEYRQDGTANCLRTPNGGRDGMGMGAVAYGFYSNEGSHGMGDNREMAPSLKIGSGTGAVPPAVAKPPVVRRLTPVECCRLQGFPDDWNAEGIDKSGKRIPMADSSRYKQLGNAVTVNVAEWLAKRISAAT